MTSVKCRLSTILNVGTVGSKKAYKNIQQIGRGDGPYCHCSFLRKTEIFISCIDLSNLFHFLLDICDIKPKNRNECGWFGIDQGTCEKKGCCWDSTHQDALFCFNSKRGPRKFVNILFKAL